MTRSRRRDLPSRDGFALVVVIWGLAIITLLIVTFMTTARWRLQAAFNISGAARADLLAVSAIDAAILSLASERNRDAAATQRAIAAQGESHDGRPRFCALAGAVAAVAIEDEAGKVDLNNAPSKLLKALFTGFGVDMREADTLANAIVAFRTPPTNAVGTPDADQGASRGSLGPKRAPFQTVLELDQVTGDAERDLFRSIAPFVTVHTRRAGIDAAAAPPALFAALAGFPIEDVREMAKNPFPNKLDRKDPRFPQEFKQGEESDVFLVHAEVVLPTGQTGLREAIVDVRGGAFAVRERRHGVARYLDELRGMQRDAAALPDC